MHECYADECDRVVPDQLLMCADCWRRVPAELQHEVYAAYSRGRGLGTERHEKAIEAARQSLLAGLIFEVRSQGFVGRAFEIKGSAEARIVVLRDGKPFRESSYPAYRVWNIAAHFEDSVADLLAGEEADRAVETCGGDV